MRRPILRARATTVAPSATSGTPAALPRPSCGVIGELLITAGCRRLLFIGWQLWLSELLVGNEQQAQAQQLSQEWNEQARRPRPRRTPRPHRHPDPEQTDAPGTSAPPVQVAPPNAGEVRGAHRAALGSRLLPHHRRRRRHRGRARQRASIGHYPTTQMPGAVGNFAIAAHRIGVTAVRCTTSTSCTSETTSTWRPRPAGT